MPSVPVRTVYLYVKMSNIYIQEPATNGKVILTTTVGEIEIELWSRECPIACRNFVQLCLDGYYDGTVFHRVVPSFIVQGGDPTGTGDGGEAAAGKPFQDEFHTRLRYNRRGLVGMVNSGPNTNGSQFFFTMGPTTELEKKNTLFGKVVGNTLFNMLKLEEGEIEDEKPLHKQKVLHTEVISNPFDNMVANPRSQTLLKTDEQKDKSVVSAKAIKNFGLLSFGNEAEEDEEEINQITTNFKQRGGGKSAHDLMNDPTLSKQSILHDENPNENPNEIEQKKVDIDDNDTNEQLEIIRNKLKSNENSKKKIKDNKEPEASVKSNDTVKNEIHQIRKELKQAKKQPVVVNPTNIVETPNIIEAIETFLIHVKVLLSNKLTMRLCF
ncbi:unnamed protein product [Didymodactylos carnosus]|uniref:Spliceosome-associated protein CWC27 homolog n=1 Tax=Didymodactylos carnosus TaxID=1234261 RepID=A0A814GKE6_9BILA|nr:unnamed protein product [Didymodactylos carnosus]CAF3769052.1 unnamed protein product [Didymodactylos carnosus]